MYALVESWFLLQGYFSLRFAENIIIVVSLSPKVSYSPFAISNFWQYTDWVFLISRALIQENWKEKSQMIVMMKASIFLLCINLWYS